MSMRPTKLAAAAITLSLLACAPAGQAPPPAHAEPPPASGAPQHPTNHSDPALPVDDGLCAPLLLEQDLGFGTHVVMRRLPTAADLNDLRYINGLRQLIIALPAWPASYDDLRPLQQVILPEDAELVVLLPGWPPNFTALDAWNMVGGNLRLIMLVNGPPADRSMITELNRLKPLERVIAQMEYPERSGFERLQRPLSFRVLKR